MQQGEDEQLVREASPHNEGPLEDWPLRVGRALGTSFRPGRQGLHRRGLS